MHLVILYKHKVHALSNGGEKMGKVIEFPIRHIETAEEVFEEEEYEFYDKELEEAYREYYAEYLKNN